MKTDVAALRQEYRRRSLRKSEAHSNPIQQFMLWFEEAVEAGVLEPNAMTLATAGADNQPSARMVLLKDVSPDGFAFFTNFRSRKARELAANPRAALTIWWSLVQRQVRIEGSVEQMAPGKADVYFARRPRESQLGAWSSSQSEPVENRSVLEENLRRVREQYEGKDVPRPPHWGGYRLKPEAIEFWQGREGRLHDRLRFTRSANSGWDCSRLAP